MTKLDNIISQLEDSLGRFGLIDENLRQKSTFFFRLKRYWFKKKRAIEQQIR